MFPIEPVPELIQRRQLKLKGAKVAALHYCETEFRNSAERFTNPEIFFLLTVNCDPKPLPPVRHPANLIVNRPILIHETLISVGEATKRVRGMQI